MRYPAEIAHRPEWMRHYPASLARAQAAVLLQQLKVQVNASSLARSNLGPTARDDRAEDAVVVQHVRSNLITYKTFWFAAVHPRMIPGGGFTHVPT